MSGDQVMPHKNATPAGNRRARKHKAPKVGALCRVMVGRGNLNWWYKLLILKYYVGLVFLLECHLECR